MRPIVPNIVGFLACRGPARSGACGRSSTQQTQHEELSSAVHISSPAGESSKAEQTIERQADEAHALAGEAAEPPGASSQSPRPQGRLSAITVGTGAIEDGQFVSYQAANHTGWGKQDCTHCRAPFWKRRGSALARDMCSACIRNPNRVQTCGICLEPRAVYNEHNTPKLHHRCNAAFCKPCMLAHCNYQIRGGALACHCPDPGCQVILVHEELQRISQDVATALQEVQARAREAREREAHADLLAALFESSDPSLLRWAASGVAQLCPQCLTLVEKQGGCHHMTCRCRKQFCFVCGGEWPCRKSSCSHATTSHIASGVHVLLERQKQRRYTFLLSSRCGDECVASRLPAEVLRQVTEYIR